MGGYYYAAGYGQRFYKAYVYFPRGFRIRPADFRDSVEEATPTFYDQPTATTWDEGVFGLFQRMQRLQQFGPNEEIETMETLLRLMPRPDIFFADQMNNPHLSFRHYHFLHDITMALNGFYDEEDRPTMEPMSWLPILEETTNYQLGFKGNAPATKYPKPSPGSVGELHRKPFELNPTTGNPLYLQPTAARWLDTSWSFPWAVQMLYILFGPLSSHEGNV